MSLTDDLSWWDQFRATDAYRRLQTRPVAYFCAEFALISHLKTYSGGLGVLSGDILREAADQKFPLVGVGLLYNQPSFNSGQAEGVAREGPPLERPQLSSVWARTSERGRARQDPEGVPETFGLESVLAAGSPLTVKVPIQDRYVTVAAYRWPAVKLGSGWWTGGVRSAPVYLLTTDYPGNDPRDCCITDQLYPPDKEKRLQQEIILGLAGLRLLEALGIHPSIYHLNEGHSAFLALEIIRHEMTERMIGFDDALNLARRHVVFTNHTLVPAGQDIFSNDLVAANLAKYAEELAVPVDRLVQLGLVQESSLFSMTMLSLRLAGKTNAVSRLHAQKAAQIWTDHPMTGITNGIHVGTWDRIANFSEHSENSENRNIGKSDNQKAGNEKPLDFRRSESLTLRPSEYSEFSDICDCHLANKRRLLDRIKNVTGRQWPEDCLLLGWARRFVGYKRPLALFFDPVWLTDICTRPGRPVRLVISGNVQPGDPEGEKLLKELTSLRATGGSVAIPYNVNLSQITAYLPDYDLELAQLLTSGCDVWLNTPVVGFEACGTSGMKACLNGVLPISTKDGWMAEIDPIGIGWLIDSDKVSDALYQTLENQIIPLYFDHRQEWLKNMASARELILNRFTTTRVLKQYIEKLYLPALTI